MITRTLDHIGEPTDAPTLSAARGPPVDESVDQMDLFDESFNDIPEDEMDQSLSW